MGGCSTSCNFLRGKLTVTATGWSNRNFSKLSKTAGSRSESNQPGFWTVSLYSGSRKFSHMYQFAIFSSTERALYRGQHHRRENIVIMLHYAYCIYIFSYNALTLWRNVIAFKDIALSNRKSSWLLTFGKQRLIREIIVLKGIALSHRRQAKTTLFVR